MNVLCPNGEGMYQLIKLGIVPKFANDGFFETLLLKFLIRAMRSNHVNVIQYLVKKVKNLDIFTLFRHGDRDEVIDLCLKPEIKNEIMPALLLHAMRTNNDRAIQFLNRRMRFWDILDLIKLRNSAEVVELCIKHKIMPLKSIIAGVSAIVDPDLMGEAVIAMKTAIAMKPAITVSCKPDELPLFKFARTDAMLTLFIGECENADLFYHALKHKCYETIKLMIPKRLIAKNIALMFDICDFNLLEKVGLKLSDVSILSATKFTFKAKPNATPEEKKRLEQEQLEKRIKTYGKIPEFNLRSHLSGASFERLLDLANNGIIYFNHIVDEFIFTTASIEPESDSDFEPEPGVIDFEAFSVKNTIRLPVVSDVCRIYFETELSELVELVVEHITVIDVAILVISYL